MLSACGNDSGSEQGGGDLNADDQAYVDEMAAAMSDDGEGESPFPAAEVKCWVGDMAEGIGVDKLTEAGFTVEELNSDSPAIDGEVLTDGDRKVMTDSFNECIDIEAMFTGTMDAAGGDEELPPEVTECFADLDWDAQGAAVVDMMLTGEEPAQDSPANVAFNQCMEISMNQGDGMSGDVEAEMDGSDNEG